jgi:AcrR family transcriptional regulator
MPAPPDQPVKRKRSATVTRRYGGIDAAQRRQERQRKLIEAGLVIFGSRGFHLSTVRDVCAQAGLTERYFYESFKTLCDLFDAVYADLRQQLQQCTTAAIMGQGLMPLQPMAIAEATLTAWYTFLHEDPRRARIMLFDAVSISDSGMRGAEATVQEFKSHLRSFLSEQFKDIAQLGVDLDVIIAALAGATVYIAKNWVQSGFVQPITDILRHNMLIFQSLDQHFRQLRQQPDASAGSPPHAAA